MCVSTIKQYNKTSDATNMLLIVVALPQCRRAAASNIYWSEEVAVFCVYECTICIFRTLAASKTPIARWRRPRVVLLLDPNRISVCVCVGAHDTAITIASSKRLMCTRSRTTFARWWWWFYMRLFGMLNKMYPHTKKNTHVQRIVFTFIIWYFGVFFPFRPWLWYGQTIFIRHRHSSV